MLGASRRKWIVTTKRDPEAKASHDLVQRNFTASRPDQLWFADITYGPTYAGFVFLAVVLRRLQPSRRRLGRG